ncbi:MULTISPECIES: PucR family transcriptional regulator [unclassified Microbacterium]|uniref:PucR family transcriptional regulator n=1 Tax=unclassified Microbacterium TaxID=2609290 RepID=UPI0036682650
MSDGALSRLRESGPTGPTLGLAIDTLGERFTVVGEMAAHRARTYSGVRFHDEAEDPDRYRGCVVLCPGIGDGAVADVQGRLLDAGAVAVFVPGSAALGTDLPPMTFALRAGDWAELANLLRSLLALAPEGQTSEVRLGDLFGLANALASLASAAVSLVDATGQVVGYSTHAGQPIDEMRRRSTLLLREEIALSLDPDYRAVLAARRPLHFPPANDGSPDAIGDFGRVAIAVRASGEFLGSVWVVQVDAESASRTERLLGDIEPLVAEHMLRARERADDDDRRDSALLRTIVENEAQARTAASQLMIRPDDGCHVVCFRVHAADDVTVARGLHRLLALVRSFASTSALRVHATIIGPQVVTLITGSAQDRIRAFAGAVTRIDAALVAGIGTEARTAAGIGRSYREALSCATLLAGSATGTDADPRRSQPTLDPESSSAARVASFDEVRDRLAIQHIGDLIRGSEVVGGDAAERLLAHDRASGGDLARTILVYLDLQSSVRATAESMHIHQNTVRYRLELLRRELGIDLALPATRLWLWLRLSTALRDIA